ncbi:hypothetical protein Pcinc_030576 [Petrolisthes cinctipes]|uniref:Uncharacterized protein n=1 Tax=Petrolisthes cinctipes TaxID=88211 RepID=A0AAE1K490_PETCI|nr:hypothetical protein Pcinc_030576 [Petrolisthes cinctipes]
MLKIGDGKSPKERLGRVSTWEVACGCVCACVCVSGAEVCEAGGDADYLHCLTHDHTTCPSPPTTTLGFTYYYHHLTPPPSLPFPILDTTKPPPSSSFLLDLPPLHTHQQNHNLYYHYNQAADTYLPTYPTKPKPTTPITNNHNHQHPTITNIRLF